MANKRVKELTLQRFLDHVSGLVEPGMADRILANNVHSEQFESKIDPMFRSDWKGTYRESLNVKPVRPMLKFVNRGRR